jgi:hypothetical protein
VSCTRSPRPFTVPTRCLSLSIWMDMDILVPGERFVYIAVSGAFCLHCLRGIRGLFLATITTNLFGISYCMRCFQGPASDS